MVCGINSYLISSRRFDSVLTAAMVGNARDANQEIKSCSILVSDERNDVMMPTDSDERAGQCLVS